MGTQRVRWTDLSGEIGAGEEVKPPSEHGPLVWREGQSLGSRARSGSPARESVMAWARHVCRDASAVFLDTETTGLGPTAEIVDIAVVRCDGAVLLDTLVRPTNPIPARVSRIHGIYDHHVRRAPTWEEVVAELCALLCDRRVIVYNAEFDSKMIGWCAERVRAELPPIRYECAMRQYAAYFGSINGRSGAYRWHKLEHAARHLGVSPGGHRALGDAEACRQVVLGMAEGRRPAG